MIAYMPCYMITEEKLLVDLTWMCRAPRSMDEPSTTELLPPQKTTESEPAKSMLAPYMQAVVNVANAYNAIYCDALTENGGDRRMAGNKASEETQSATQQLWTEWGVPDARMLVGQTASELRAGMC